jgi:hypothetical protein
MALNLYRRHRRDCKAGHPEEHLSSEFDERKKGWRRCDCPIFRAELSAANAVSEELQDGILGRFYSSLREQAFFCAAGTRQRGLVVFEQERIRYVPEHRLDSTLPLAQGRAKQVIRRAVRTYDPWLEAIILLLCGGWCSVWCAHEHSAVKWLAYSRLEATAGLL